MVSKVNIHEAQTHFPNLLLRVAAGEEIIITKAGEPIALLAPYAPLPEQRQPGNDAKHVRIAPDFDHPLTEFDEG